jgi:hypothetical protein
MEHTFKWSICVNQAGCHVVLQIVVICFFFFVISLMWHPFIFHIVASFPSHSCVWVSCRGWNEVGCHFLKNINLCKIQHVFRKHLFSYLWNMLIFLSLLTFFMPSCMGRLCWTLITCQNREVSKYLVNSSVTLFSDVIATDILWIRRKFNALKRVVVDCGQHYVEECQCLMGHLALRMLNFETYI